MKFHVASLLAVCLCASCLAQNLTGQKSAPAARTFAGATPLDWSRRLADSEIARKGDSLNWKPGGKAKWDYAAGLFTLSLLHLSDATQNDGYRKFAAAATGSLIGTEGAIQGYQRDEYQLDAVNPGKTVLALWQITGDVRYRQTAALLRQQLVTQPRTPDGGFWHKQRYTNQMWLDGIYMAAPFLAEYGQRFDEPAAFDEVAHQLRLIDQHIYNPGSGLNYHGWDATKSQPWANPITGCSSNFWGRAEGWYAMALVDVLDFFPTNHPEREQIVATFRKTAAGIVKWQDPATGLWWQVMDQGSRPGNYHEATASAMFVYALAKGVNRGYLPRDYVPAIEKGYAGIVKNLLQAEAGQGWSLAQCCSVAGLGGSPSNGRMRDGSFSYYVGEPVVKNDLKGVGPFILAGIEMEMLSETRIQ